MPTVPALQHQFRAMPQKTRDYLTRLEPLLRSNSLDVALAYLFMKVEEGNHRGLKAALIKRHKCDSKKCDDALAKQHFTRDYYKKIFKNVVGKKFPDDAAGHLSTAEKVRDLQIHGKNVSDAKLREGISNALFYVEKMVNFLESEDIRSPYGDLRGLAGRASLLDGPRTYWLLKGMGFYQDESGKK